MKETTKKITGNVGEWSELYALNYILTHGGMFGADENQNKKEALFYKVIKVIFDGKNEELDLVYEIRERVIDVYRNKKKITSLKRNDVKNILEDMYSALSVHNAGRAFSLNVGNKVMKLLLRKVMKASSSKKKDIDLILVDITTKSASPKLGFSIKSQLGGAPTLVNASRATNFTFEILDKDLKVPKTLPKLEDKMVKDNTQLLLSSGYNLVFRKIDSKVFQSNLSLIDSNLPKNLAKLLLAYYSKDASGILELVDTNFSGTNAENKQAIHKVKEFLSTMASGMMPNTKWDGILTSLGGLILVKKDGDVLCYYLYNLKDFQSYLLKNTKFETPSTTRYGIGKIIEENRRYFYKLNLQVRFIK